MYFHYLQKFPESKCQIEWLFNFENRCTGINQCFDLADKSVRSTRKVRIFIIENTVKVKIKSLASTGCWKVWKWGDCRCEDVCALCWTRERIQAISLSSCLQGSSSRPLVLRLQRGSAYLKGRRSRNGDAALLACRQCVAAALLSPFRRTSDVVETLTGGRCGLG